MCWAPAVTLHEIRPKSLYPEWENDPENSVPICAACHDIVQADTEGTADHLHRLQQMRLWSLANTKGITNEDFLHIRSALLSQEDQ